MATLSREQHPAHVPIPVPQLPAFVAEAAIHDFKTKPKALRDWRKEQIRAQLFWYDIAHTDRMTLPTLEKTLREAVEGRKASFPTRIVVLY
jgi:hypothetical protein